MMSRLLISSYNSHKLNILFSIFRPSTSNFLFFKFCSHHACHHPFPLLTVNCDRPHACYIFAQNLSHLSFAKIFPFLTFSNRSRLIPTAVSSASVVVSLALLCPWHAACPELCPMRFERVFACAFVQGQRPGRRCVHFMISSWLASSRKHTTTIILLLIIIRGISFLVECLLCWDNHHFKNTHKLRVLAAQHVH